MVLLDKIQEDHGARTAISYESLEKAFQEREYLQKQIFRNAFKIQTWEEMAKQLSGKQKGYLLSTLNQWTIFEGLRNGKFPETVLIVEDDIYVVPDFKRKLSSLQKQMSTLNKPWEVYQKSPLNKYF